MVDRTSEWVQHTGSLTRSSSAPVLPDFGRGPRENELDVPKVQRQLSEVELLRQTRYTPILHSSLREALPLWKTRIPHQPRWPHKYHPYHLLQGLAVVDTDHVQLSSRDQVVQGQHRRGTRKTSCGEVHFGHGDREKVMLDALHLVGVLTGITKRHMQGWTVHDLDFEFRKTGRIGIWQQHGLPLYAFLSLFPKTFQQYGSRHQYVRLKQQSRPCVLDDFLQVMVNLARYNDKATLFQEPNYTHEQASRSFDPDHPNKVTFPTGPGPTKKRLLGDTGYAGPKHLYTHTYQGFEQMDPPPPYNPPRPTKFVLDHEPVVARPPHVNHRFSAALDVKRPIAADFLTEQPREPSAVWCSTRQE